MISRSREALGAVKCYNGLMKRNEVIQRLKARQDLKYRDFHSGLCPGTTNILGVRIPDQRRLAMEVARGNYLEFLEEARGEFYEELTVEGLVIATAKMSFQERLELLRKFVPKINNWATCDTVCASLWFRPDETEAGWRFITSYRESGREFELRFMFVMMLDHFMKAEYIEDILAVVAAVRSESYYVKMAQAWLVAEIFIKFRERGIEFLKGDNLLPWTQNKAIQKIRESYRVSDADKELVKGFKKIRI